MQPIGLVIKTDCDLQIKAPRKEVDGPEIEPAILIKLFGTSNPDHLH